jgi:hypothetical protein
VDEHPPEGGAPELGEQTDRPRVAALRAGVAQRFLGVCVHEHARSRRLELRHDAGVVRVCVGQDHRVHVGQPEPDRSELGLERVGKAGTPASTIVSRPSSSTA